MPSAELRISGDGAGSAVAALSPETTRELPRTHTSITMEDGIAVLRVEADDSTALRAAINSFLECVAVTEDIGRIIEERT